MKKEEIKKRLDEYVLFNMQNWLSVSTPKQAQEKETVDSNVNKISLESALSEHQTTFQEMLFEFIDERELKDTEVYKSARIDRKLFSRIRCKSDYKPKKDTALLLAIALKLSITETEELLHLAELALSPGVRFDLIIRFCITNGLYDIDEINELLNSYGEHMLGV